MSSVSCCLPARLICLGAAPVVQGECVCSWACPSQGHAFHDICRFQELQTMCWIQGVQQTVSCVAMWSTMRPSWSVCSTCWRAQGAAHTTAASVPRRPHCASGSTASAARLLLPAICHPAPWRYCSPTLRDRFHCHCQTHVGLRSSSTVLEEPSTFMLLTSH